MAERKSYPQVGRNGVISIGYDEPEDKYVPITEDYIDFPCSELWRDYYEETLYGRHPQTTNIIIQKEERPITQLTRIGKHEFEQLTGRVAYLENKRRELETKKEIYTIKE